MQIETTPLPPGLHFVSTPIGAARDITLRGLDTLANADILAAEDTRTLRHLMQIHGVALRERQVIAYHEHSAESVRTRLIDAIAEGRSVAYASEAGTPLVADPGFQLARAAIVRGLPVIAAPGPSAVLAALTVSGLPSDRFMFAGFAPSAASARRAFLQDLAPLQATLVLYESPRRLLKLLADMEAVMGPDRRAVICRELTKKFEEVARGSVQELTESFSARSIKGEIVVLIDRAAPVQADEQTLDAALRDALATQRVKEAATQVAQALKLPRRQVYQRALELGRE